MSASQAESRGFESRCPLHFLNKKGETGKSKKVNKLAFLETLMEKLLIFYIIIEEKPNSASLNMAIDEALFNYVQKNKECSILRFYRWEKPTLSIGYNQKVKETVNMNFLSINGIEIVRRITGGKAVLHDDEVTYSISSSASIMVENKSVIESFHLISSALIEGLKILGINASLSSRKYEGLYKTNLPCFSYPTGNEIVVNGRKLIGSAQKRTKNALLQHGSIPITLDVDKLGKATLSNPESLRENISTIKELVGETDFFKIANSLKEGFSRFFKCNFEPFELIEIIKDVEKLEKEKYSNPEWNFSNK